MIDALILPIVAMGIPVVLVPAVMGMKHARRERELEHAERMRALELGRTLPQDESWWSPARLGLAIGLTVPIGVFFCAAVATLLDDFHDTIWVASAIVGVAGVVCGSRLAGRQSASQGYVGTDFAKPSVDEDAYDVAGMRG